MPYPQLFTIWRVSAVQLSICWMYGRVRERVDGKVQTVQVTLNPQDRVRDYETKRSTPTTQYFDKYQDAVRFLQECLLDEAESLTKVWKKSKQQEHGRSILKAEKL